MYNPTIRYTYDSPEPWSQATLSVTVAGSSNLQNLPKYQEASQSQIPLQLTCPFTIGTIIKQKVIVDLVPGRFHTFSFSITSIVFVNY
jgi:hypothetical protein